jgi:hypothetical protein
MKILLHSNQLNIGGTEVALWDYACGCEDILKHNVTIASMTNGIHNHDIINKFSSRFKTIFYNPGELHKITQDIGIDISYFITDGQRNDNLLIPGIKNVIHAVFSFNEPHGDVYAYVSEWLSLFTTNGQLPWVPHIVNPINSSNKNLRAKLNIPEEAIVFGGYGRKDQFNIQFVQNAIKTISETNPNLYFLFMNFDRFMEDRKNVIFIPGVYHNHQKAEFIDTCDAMLHGRLEGETFGLAIAEFSIRNKPIITYGQSHDKAHLFMLGNKAIAYNNAFELNNIILQFYKTNYNWNAYDKFSAQNVMNKFSKVFLE